MSEKFLLERIKSEGVILAVIPFLGSLAAFAFEVGYLSYYDVPFDVINLSFYRILASTLWLSLGMAIAWIFLSKAIAIFMSPNQAIKNLFLLVMAIAFTVLAIKTIEFNKFFLIAIAGAIIPTVASLFAWTFGENSPFREKISKTIVQAVKDGEEIAERSQKISNIYLMPFALIATLLVIVSCLGFLVAKIHTNTWVLDDQPTFILVRKYDQSYIFKEYNPKTSMIDGRVLITTIEENKKISIRRINIKGLISNFGKHTTQIE